MPPLHFCTGHTYAEYVLILLLKYGGANSVGQQMSLNEAFRIYKRATNEWDLDLEEFADRRDIVKRGHWYQYIMEAADEGVLKLDGDEMLRILSLNTGIQESKFVRPGLMKRVTHHQFDHDVVGLVF